MNYTNANLREVGAALIEKYGFDRSMQWLCRAWYASDSEWNELIRNEISSHRPVIYQGSDTRSETFIIDGYSSENKDLFHISRGDDIRDGWYTLREIDAMSDPANSNYNRYQQALIGIMPDEGGSYYPGAYAASGPIEAGESFYPELNGSCFKFYGKKGKLTFTGLDKSQEKLLTPGINATDIDSGTTIFLPGEIMYFSNEKYPALYVDLKECIGGLHETYTIEAAYMDADSLVHPVVTACGVKCRMKLDTYSERMVITDISPDRKMEFDNICLGFDDPYIHLNYSTLGNDDDYRHTVIELIHSNGKKISDLATFTPLCIDAEVSHCVTIPKQLAAGKYTVRAASYDCVFDESIELAKMEIRHSTSTPVTEYESPVVCIEVYDLCGMPVKRGAFPEITQIGLPAGFYIIVETHSDGSVSTRKLLLE